MRWAQYKASFKNATQSRSMNTKLRVRTAKGKTYAELGLSHCAADYAKALVMPFSLDTMACIPDLHGVPSKKLRVVNRGTFSTGLGGVGYIAQIPWCASSDSSDVISTTSAYNLGTTILKAGTNVNSLNYNTKLPYPSAAWAGTTTGGIRHRIVGCGLRIRYIGPESARSGQIVGFREPDNGDVTGMTFDTIRALETSVTYRNTEKWHYVMFRPANPSEYEYGPFACSPDNNGTAPTDFQLTQGFVITGTTDINGSPSPAPFEWESVRFIEYIGNINGITRTHVDIEGLSHVRNGLPVKSTTDHPVKHVISAASKIFDSVKDAAPVVGGAMLANHFLGSSAAETAEAMVPALEGPVASGGMLGTLESAATGLLEYLPAGVAEFAETAAPLAMALL